MSLEKKVKLMVQRNVVLVSNSELNVSYSESPGATARDKKFTVPGGVLQGGTKEKKSAFNRIGTDKIRFVSRKKASFGFLWIALKLGIILLPLTLLHTVVVLKEHNEGTALRNMINLYSTAYSMFNNMELQRVSFNYAFAFNSSYLVNGSSPAKTYGEALSMLRVDLTSKLTASKFKNLGNFSSLYQQLLTSTNFCTYLSRPGNQYFTLNETCGAGLTSFLNGNMLIVLNNIASEYEAFSLVIGVNQSDASKVTYFQIPKFKLLYTLGLGGQLSSVFRDLLSGPLSQAIDDAIGKSSLSNVNCEGGTCSFGVMLSIDSYAQLIFILDSVISIIGLFLCYFWAAKDFKFIYRINQSIALMLPPKVIKSNPLLARILKGR